GAQVVDRASGRGPGGAGARHQDLGRGRGHPARAAHRPVQPDYRRQGARVDPGRRPRAAERGDHPGRRGRRRHGRRSDRRPVRPPRHREARGRTMSEASHTADVAVDPARVGSTTATQARRGLTASRATLRGLVLPLLLILVWEAAARPGLVAANLLPAPTAVLRAIADLAATGELFGHIEVTLSRVFFGFLAGGAAATVLGGLTGYSRLWRELLDPLLQALRNIPSIAWVP